MKNLRVNKNDVTKNSVDVFFYLIPIVICSVGLILTSIIYYPGWMSADSMVQYSQALEGSYGDWHPVLMAWWWNKLLVLAAGPAPLLFQNLFLYWSAWALFALGLSRQIGWWAVPLPIMGFWPGLLLVLGNIWKDVVFSTSIIFVFSLIFFFQSHKKRPNWFARCLMLFFIVLAVGTKPNGLIVIPFVLYFWAISEFGPLFRRLFLYLFALAGTGISYLLSLLPLIGLKIKIEDSSQYLKVYDLVGISVRSGKNYLPSYLEKQLTDANVNWREVYDNYSGNPLFWPPNGGGAMTQDPTNLEKLSSAWGRAILREPYSYFAHREDHFGIMLGIDQTLGSFVSMKDIVPNQYGLTYKPNSLAKMLFDLSDLHPAWFFTSWVYLLFTFVSGIALFIISAPLRVFAITFGFSAILFTGLHFFVGPAPDFRYFFYSDTVALVLFGIVSLIALSKIWSLIKN